MEAGNTKIQAMLAATKAALFAVSELRKASLTFITTHCTSFENAKPIATPGRLVDVAHRVPVGVDTEIEHAVIRRHPERQHLIVQQRRNRIGSAIWSPRQISASARRAHW